jgi:hypothetical protein
VLKKIFGLKRDEVTGEWRKLHDFYPSPSVITVIMVMRMRWAWHVAPMGEKRNLF